MSVLEQEFRMNPGVPLDAILERVFYWPLVWFAVSASLRNGCHRFLPATRADEQVCAGSRERANEPVPIKTIDISISRGYLRAVLASILYATSLSCF